jgi:hypothetical protein
MDINEMGIWECELGFSGSGSGPGMGFCEQDNDVPYQIICRTFL